MEDVWRKFQQSVSPVTKGTKPKPKAEPSLSANWGIALPWATQTSSGRKGETRLQQLEREAAELRSQLLMQGALIDGWTRFMRDVLHAALISRRETHYAEVIAGALARGVGEIEGVRSIKVEEVVLPTSSSWAPTLALVRHEREHVTTWDISWEPPPEQLSARIRLDGAKFGRSFSVVAHVRELRIRGSLRIGMRPADGEKGELDVAFIKPPMLDLRVRVDGSWVGSPLKPVLVHLLTKHAAANWCEPSRITRPMPGIPVPPPRVIGPEGYDDDDAAEAAAAAAVAAAAAEMIASSAEAEAQAQAQAELDPVLSAVLPLQRPDAQWALDSRLAAALGTSLGELLQRMPDELEDRQLHEGAEADAPPSREWASAIVLGMLRLHYHDSLAVWSPRTERLGIELPQNVQRAAMETVIDLGLGVPAQS
mmetsp:Transcript_22663/g.58302  ORF Transcript_22663/g.58302 Transcript_22663/m.58302 type:complete len:424 (-) Transcript_22663:110-1381(-)|eukprot:CAMPEP_0119408952 /NCGR_PEP_ID=MMETSP1335-20130426/2354_1 /TAXON_ID=259385 /ORGANISM="Chrysoculter rhomboideus, Strain RCC1486" /LENGTH=423 /DNA_ID=CAMNT_0007433245 /DNA_START=42 /DNA_END=1313 /DNA_ORIENTATION=+